MSAHAWLRGLGRALYERRYGVRTADRVDLADLGLDGADRVYYVPLRWGALRKALPKGEVSGRDVFLDFGSGKGRVVVEAARYPFRRVIGVELSAELAGIARDNVRNMRVRRRCGEIELVVSDVLDYAIPDDVTVTFFNNPFRGPIFSAVIDRLVASADRAPRPVRVIYYNPVEEAYLLGTGRFRHVRTIPLTPDPLGPPFGTFRIYDLLPGSAGAAARVGAPAHRAGPAERGQHPVEQQHGQVAGGVEDAGLAPAHQGEQRAEPEAVRRHRAAEGFELAVAEPDAYAAAQVGGDGPGRADERGGAGHRDALGAGEARVRPAVVGQHVG
ncbi:MAG TPA: class I SAM-dependent methyltransferase [Nonomuraea sp.]|nr:class I SAM-dependent methyltransferase [Nonomuraea sp.]